MLGYGHSWFALWIIPLGFLVGLCFGAFGLVMNALAPSYDFFTYFFTLVLTPMLLLSGVFFPVEQMPPPLQTAAGFLPLKHVRLLHRRERGLLLGVDLELSQRLVVDDGNHAIEQHAAIERWRARHGRRRARCVGGCRRLGERSDGSGGGERAHTENKAGMRHTGSRIQGRNR